jgi:tetratricopeptide (TPR) repeat protein
MKMKQSIVLAAALTLSVSVKAQSLENGVKMYQYERYQSAINELAPVAATNPMANYYLGLAELALDSTAAAKTTFSKYPDNEANMAGLARVAYMTGSTPEGNRLTSVVASKAKKKDWEPLKYAADAITYTKGGSIQQAIDWYKEALKRNDNTPTHIALGDAYQQIQGGGGEAMNNYEKVTAKEPQNSLAFSRIGALWYAAKNYDLALENYQKAKDADPSNPLPYRDLANAYFWTGKYDLAKQNIEKYLELSDKSTEDLINYSNILYLSKDYPNAIKTVQDVLKTGVTKPGLYGILGFSQLETGDTVNALKNIRTYFNTQDPAKITSFDMIQFAKTMSANGKADSANYYYNLAVSKDTAKDKSETYRQIAEAFKTAKDYEKSAGWYDKLVKENPDAQALDYFWRGAMYYYSKQYDKAATAFQDMETKYPDQPSATYWRGRVAAAKDEEARTCEASPFYESWLTKVGPDYDKKSDLMYAYQYLALCAYNKTDKPTMQKYMDKIEQIDPNNAFLKQLKEAAKAPSKGSK